MLLSRLRSILPLYLQRKFFKCVTIKSNGKKNGDALVSYAVTSAGRAKDHPMFRYHSGPWESNIIVSILSRLGYEVDVIHYNDKRFVLKKKYDVIFGVTGNLLRLVNEAKGNPKIIFHPRTSSIRYNNRREHERIAALKKRKGVLYTPKRQEPYEELEDTIFEMADGVIAIASDHTLSTYLERFRKKIKKITVSASPLQWIKKESNYVPHEREFLWHFGNGAVHKGLDLVLEVFARHPEWTLNIMGLVERESDFMEIYKRELTELSNIKLHGYIDPSSSKFREIVSLCFAFIAPSCSESISVACAMMMQAGLYPLVSHDTGIVLPEGSGMYLERCTGEEIEQSVGTLYAMKENDLRVQIGQTQTHALREYTRERFEETMSSFIECILKR